MNAIQLSTPTPTPTPEFGATAGPLPTVSAFTSGNLYGVYRDSYNMLIYATVPDFGLTIAFFVIWYAILLIMAFKWVKRFVL